MMAMELNITHIHIMKQKNMKAILKKEDFMEQEKNRIVMEKSFEKENFLEENLKKDMFLIIIILIKRIKNSIILQ